MDWIIHWLLSNKMLAWIGTLIISGSAIAAFIRKYSPVARKYVKAIRESLDLIDTLCDALQDNEIKEDEIKAIMKEAQDFKNAYRDLKGV